MWKKVLCVGIALAFPCSLSSTRADVLASQAPSGIWVTQATVLGLPMSGSAWTGLLNAANKSCGTPNLSDQDDPANVCVMAKALVFARTGQTSYRTAVVSALTSVVNSGTYNGRALALGRELGAYVIAADLIDLKNHAPSLDTQFRAKIWNLLFTPTTEGPVNLIDCHETRPNNWGTHCGSSRAAVAAYLGDTAQLDWIAKVFKGWLGDRSSYAGFVYGDTSWQCDPNRPVGVNPAGCARSGHSIDGVLPDDQRRASTFTWPPPQENYVYEALQGALGQAIILQRAGYDVFNWENRALLRAFNWLRTEAGFDATGDDSWEPHVVNHFYNAQFPAPTPSQPGKNVGWTDWSHQGTGSISPTPTPTPSVVSATSLALSPSTLLGGLTSTGTVSLSGAAPSGGATVALSSNLLSAAVPPSIVVPAGSSSASFPVLTTAVVTNQQAVISATYNGTVQATLTVTAPTGGGAGGTGKSLGAEADAYVRGGQSAGRNYGTAKDLELKDAPNTDYDRRVFIRFDLRSVASASSATLKIYVSRLPNGSPVPVCASLVSNDSWTERGITWNNQPSHGSNLACASASRTGWVTLDVTNIVRQEIAGDGRVSLMLSDGSTANRMAELVSREGSSSSRPVLEIK